MSPKPGARPHFGNERADAIVERDPLTRFSDPGAPLTRFPGMTPEQIAESVRRDLERMPDRVG